MLQQIFIHFQVDLSGAFKSSNAHMGASNTAHALFPTPVVATISIYIAPVGDAALCRADNWGRPIGDHTLWSDASSLESDKISDKLRSIPGSPSGLRVSRIALRSILIQLIMKMFSTIYSWDDRDVKDHHCLEFHLDFHTPWVALSCLAATGPVASCHPGRWRRWRDRYEALPFTFQELGHLELLLNWGKP